MSHEQSKRQVMVTQMRIQNQQCITGDVLCGFFTIYLHKIYSLMVKPPKFVLSTIRFSVEEFFV